MILGGGTNVLVSDSGFEGTVIRISNNSVQAEVDACSGATLTIGAGEDWDELVATTIDRGFAGLETLSGIPGTVGAAPIQNIGAYGVELKDVFERCECLQLDHLTTETFNAESCEFGYRDSVFKHKLKGKYFILSVTLRLKKQGIHLF